MYKYIPLIFQLLYSIAVPAQDKILVALGASTTYGIGPQPRDSAWIERFHDHYSEQIDLELHNLAVPGYTCYQAMPSSYQPPDNRPFPDDDHNITKALQLTKHSERPEDAVVFISFPSNGYQYFSIKEILFCLQTLYDSATDRGHPCFVTTSVPRTDGRFKLPEIKRKLAILRDSIINRFGEANTLNFYDGMYNPADSSILDEYSAGDSIHLNNKGHKELLRRVMEKNILGLVTNVPETRLRDVNLYPNPVSKVLQIGIHPSIPLNKIYLADTFGRVTEVPLRSDGMSIDMGHHPAGLYLLVIETTTGRKAYKVLKE